MRPDWGDVPGWLEALSTALGFLVVAVTLIMALRDRRAEQATKIEYYLFTADKKAGANIAVGLDSSALADLQLMILNGSANSINEVLVSVPFSQSGLTIQRLGKIPPGEHAIPYPRLDPSLNPAKAALLIPTIQFRDRSGRVWQRSALGELRRIRWRNKKRQLRPRETTMHVLTRT